MPVTYSDRLNLMHVDDEEEADLPLLLTQRNPILDTLAPIDRGPLSNRPVATGGAPNIEQFYIVSDEANRLDYCYGAGWVEGAQLTDGDGIAITGDTIAVALGANSGLGFASGLLGISTDESTVERSGGVVRLKDAGVTLAKIAAALRPSQGAGADDEALRALGVDAGEALPGNHANIPTAAEKAALAGTGAPGASAPYQTLDDWPELPLNFLVGSVTLAPTLTRADIPPAIFPVLAGQTWHIVRIEMRLQEGTSVTVKLQRSPGGSSTWTDVEDTQIITPSDHVLTKDVSPDFAITNKDLFWPAVTAASGSPKGLTFTPIAKRIA